MKNKILLLVSLFSFALTNAQTPVIDSVSLGSGYANQVWYSFENDEQGSAPKNNWDLGFNVSSFGSAIYINSVIGTKLWLYPNGDTSSWNAIDTAGLSTWNSVYNSDTSWAFGAFDATINTSDPYDVGWGVYSMITHNVIGDSIYIIKLSDNSYRKLWIQRLSAATYDFRFAQLDGSSDTYSHLAKSDFSHKKLGYYSLQTNTSLNREPVDSLWDLLFTQYTAFIPQAYTVTGVLSNNRVEIAQADQVADPSTYADWSSQNYSSLINVIGYDWKVNNSVTHLYELADSLVYFAKLQNSEIWKLVFTGFDGSATGTIHFTKQKLSATVAPAYSPENHSGFVLYPNPSNGNDVTLLFSGESENFSTLKIYDLSGRMITSEEIKSNGEFTSHRISTKILSSGMYIVELNCGASKTQKKLLVY